MICDCFYYSDMAQTVSWLANQTADRYYQLHNILPIGLTLSLVDGAKLAPNDLISSTFLADEEVANSYLCFKVFIRNNDTMSNLKVFLSRVYSEIFLLLKLIVVQFCVTLLVLENCEFGVQEFEKIDLLDVSFCDLLQCVGTAFAMATWLSVCLSR